jgi:uncharacterized membrane protein
MINIEDADKFVTYFLYVVCIFGLIIIFGTLMFKYLQGHFSKVEMEIYHGLLFERDVINDYKQIHSRLTWHNIGSPSTPLWVSKVKIATLNDASSCVIVIDMTGYTESYLIPKELIYGLPQENEVTNSFQEIANSP